MCQWDVKPYCTILYSTKVVDSDASTKPPKLSLGLCNPHEPQTQSFHALSMDQLCHSASFKIGLIILKICSQL